MAWRCELCPGLGWDGAGVSRSVRVEPVTLGASYGLDATRRGGNAPRCLTTCAGHDSCLAQSRGFLEFDRRPRVSAAKADT